MAIRSKAYLIVCSLAVLMAVGCNRDSDLGMTSGEPPSIDAQIAKIQNSKAPQNVKDYAIAQIKSHAQTKPDNSPTTK